MVGGEGRWSGEEEKESGGRVWERVCFVFVRAGVGDHLGSPSGAIWNSFLGRVGGPEGHVGSSGRWAAARGHVGGGGAVWSEAVSKCTNKK
jgi:hypothetical protein